MVSSCFCMLQAVKRGQEESDLERIQDLFPNDCLRLYDKDVITMVSLFSNDVSDFTVKML